MNVFWHELQMRRKGLIIWSIVMVIFMVMCMAKYEAIAGSGAGAIQLMMKGFPSTVQAVFGMNGLDLATVAGYFGVCFLFVAVILAVQAGLLGAGVLAEEETDKTTEFLYVKPRSRTVIMTAKLVAGLVGIATVWLFTVLGSIVSIMKFAKFGSFVPDFWRLMAALLLIQLTFFALGILAVAISKKATIYGRVVAIAVFASYLFYVFAKLSDQLSWLHYASIFSWFDAAAILQAHALKLHYVILSLVLTVIVLAAAYSFYNRRDLRV